MKLLISGSKKITDCDLSKYIPENTDFIITGENKGIEAIARKYADDNKIGKQIFISDHISFGKNAVKIRNRSMVDAADEVLIFADGKTKSSIEISNYASRKRKSVTIVFVE